MNLHERIDAITEELRALCNTENDAPRLIAEMVTREFPDVAEMIAEPELSECLRENSSLKFEIEELNDTINNMRERGYDDD